MGRNKGLWMCGQVGHYNGLGWGWGFLLTMGVGGLRIGVAGGHVGRGWQKGKAVNVRAVR